MADAPPPADTHRPPPGIPCIRRVMMPQDTNAMGTIFGGVILAEIDLAAALTAHRVHPGRLVTVAMDKVEFKQPIFVGDVVSLHGEILRVGRTSITVEIRVWAERRMTSGAVVPVTQAQVTMVAVDEENRPTPVDATAAPRGAR